MALVTVVSPAIEMHSQEKTIARSTQARWNVTKFNSAWDGGECFPGVENSLSDLGDRSAVRILLNIRAAMQLATPDVNGVIKIGSAAQHLLRIGPHYEEADRA